MEQDREKPFRVALLINSATTADRERIRGILRFAVTRGHWQTFLFRDHLANRHFAKTAHWCPDGIIAERFAFDEAMQQYGHDCCRARCAILLDTDFKLPFRCRQAVTRCDNESVGRMAAEFFLKRRYASYAVVDTPNKRAWADARREAFAARMAQAGAKCDAYLSSATRDLDDDMARMGTWLRSLPKPCALFAVVDHRAKHVLDIAAESGIAVPDELAVMGVDNDNMICEFTHPTLTSIDIDYNRNGFMAAEGLDTLMRGGKLATHNLSYGALGIVERLSTADISGSLRIVAIAREFIRRNAASDMSVEDVARVARCSARLLQQKFRAILGHTPVEEIRSVRLDLAAKLLRDTQTPVDSIGDFCGFKTLSNLKGAFKRKFGVSMSAYRRKPLVPSSR